MILALATLSFAATLKVGPAAPYATINAALSASKAGDTISVAVGTYTEEIDLRGKTVTLVSEGGPYATTIVAANPIYVDGGTFEGFTVTGATGTAIASTSGSPTLRELLVQAPGSYGFWVSGGSAAIEECAVFDALNTGFLTSGGTPVIRRSVSVDAVKYGFYAKGAGTIVNSLAIGGAYGFVVQTAASTLSNDVALGTTGGVVSAAATTVTNSVFQGNTYVAVCNGAETTFTNGIGYDKYAAKSCAATALNPVDNVDPKFTAYAAGASLWALDLHPRAGSPLIDGGSGLDNDGSTADLGLFGSNTGAWRDRDADGYPALFDCDDHEATRHAGAAEVADGEDQDCDGIIDEDIPVDTGDTGGDTGVVDTGVVDTGTDTGTIDTGIDTGDTGAGVDIDHDGYAASVDCGDHNIASYPGAKEIQDGADNDCDGKVDEGTANGDDDGDNWTILAGDCDDHDETRHPQAEETPRDGIDQDCDGVDSSPRNQDNDGDGYTDATDCDDTLPSVHPGAKDPQNGVDDDCDGLADDDSLNADVDGDGQTPFEGDCRDDDPSFATTALDIADNYIDEDCSGEDNYDVDRDGNAAPASGGTDCADLLSTTHPGASEICTDTLDNNCDGIVNDGCDDAPVGGANDGTCSCGTGTEGFGGLALGLAAAGILIRRRTGS